MALELETRVMEMYKDRSQHSGDPTGPSIPVNVLGEIS